MPNNAPEEFSPEIQAAFRDYESPPLSPDFEARFWARFEARRGRYRGLAGAFRRVWELEIEGVAVWKLMASALSGGASGALILVLALGAFAHGTPASQNAPLAPLPGSSTEFPPTAANAFAFYRRDWESDFSPQVRPKSAPPRAPKTGGEFSWNGSSAHLA